MIRRPILVTTIHSAILLVLTTIAADAFAQDAANKDQPAKKDDPGTKGPVAPPAKPPAPADPASGEQQAKTTNPAPVPGAICCPPGWIVVPPGYPPGWTPVATTQPAKKDTTAKTPTAKPNAFANTDEGIKRLLKIARGIDPDKKDGDLGNKPIRLQSRLGAIDTLGLIGGKDEQAIMAIATGLDEVLAGETDIDGTITPGGTGRELICFRTVQAIESLGWGARLTLPRLQKLRGNSAALDAAIDAAVTAIKNTPPPAPDKPAKPAKSTDNSDM